eukprot:CAMPEP_0170573420 /NCGR_PEP_ID=MMETSP0224-20130122/2756_1 /TAXON_ID=285029 /ORGANISM="Togula jolla, Strain CCCM 725" /LENGTH=39 /DNA_ID= /DNA_START= /DNA_END= /DNA_ORIENTATION=
MAAFTGSKNLSPEYEDLLMGSLKFKGSESSRPSSCSTQA